MKKILFAFILVAGFGVAANAQSNNTTNDTKAEPAKVEVAGTSATAVQPASDAGESTPATKACCSSKKGKETASAKNKSCCADGKKSKLDCADKKDDTTITQ